jgi:hypothetical protein
MGLVFGWGFSDGVVDYVGGILPYLCGRGCVVRAKVRHILEECIINGIEYGYERAHKHTDTPKESHIQECVMDAIWLEIDERFEFDRDLVSEVVEGFDHLESERESAQSAEIDVELIEEHDDGSATYRFSLTEKYADALLQNGILWAIVCGVTGVTIEQVLQDHAKNDDHINLAYELGQESAMRAMREWVGLTDDEILDALGALEAEEAVFRVARAVETNLKEKNT